MADNPSNRLVTSLPRSNSGMVSASEDGSARTAFALSAERCSNLGLALSFFSVLSAICRTSPAMQRQGCGLTDSHAPRERCSAWFAKLAELAILAPREQERPASFPRCGSSPMSGFDAKEWRDLDWRCCNPKRLHTPESRCRGAVTALAQGKSEDTGDFEFDEILGPSEVRADQQARRGDGQKFRTSNLGHRPAPVRIINRDDF